MALAGGANAREAAIGRRRRCRRMGPRPAGEGEGGRGGGSRLGLPGVRTLASPLSPPQRARVKGNGMGASKKETEERAGEGAREGGG